MKLTLWGINEYLDGTLLDFLPEVLPAERYDASILEELIYIECGDLFPYYQVPTYLKSQIKNFFLRNQEQFKRAWDALYSDYNPIENYDRIEAWSDKASESASASESLSLSSSESVHASTSTSDSTSSSSKGDVSAFNSPTYQPQSASSGQAATTSAQGNDTSGHSISAHQKLNSSGRLELDEHRGRVHGNIGVTTTQQMINQSLELANYDIYLWVVMVFQKNIISAIV